MTVENRKRYRVEVSTSVKGIHTFSCTVEIEGDQATMWDILTASDKLVAELDRRYGPGANEVRDAS